jgi:hypothetical protein
MGLGVRLACFHIILPPSPRFFGIIGLGENSILIPGLQQDAGKILESNELRVASTERSTPGLLLGGGRRADLFSRMRFSKIVDCSARSGFTGTLLSPKTKPPSEL